MTIPEPRRPVQPSDTPDGRTLVEERPHPLTPIVQLWLALVTGIFIIGREMFQDVGRLTSSFTFVDLLPALGVIGMIVVISVAGGAWVWWTTRFIVTPSEFRIEKRGLTHTSKRIAYQRIQAVDIVQPFAARLIGLAQLTIDVGGDSTKIQYLSRSRANALRDELLGRAHGSAVTDDGTLASTSSTNGAPVSTSSTTGEGLCPTATHRSLSPSKGPDPAVSTSSTSGAPVSTSSTSEQVSPTREHSRSLSLSKGRHRPILTIRPQELLLGAVLSHELYWMLAAGAVSAAISVVMDQKAIIVVLIPIVVGMFGFLSKRVTGQFNYSLTETPDGLRISRGLMSLTSSTVPLRRVQCLQVREPVLWRRIGRARVDMTVLGIKMTTDEDQAGASSIVMPIGRKQDVETAVRAIWPHLDMASISLTKAPRKARWLAPLSYRFHALGWNDDVVVVRSGWWTRTTWILPHARLQSTAASQGIIGRRQGVARVLLHPAGTTDYPRTVLLATDARQFIYDEISRAKAARFIEDEPASHAG